MTFDRADECYGDARTRRRTLPCIARWGGRFDTFESTLWIEEA